MTKFLLFIICKYITLTLKMKNPHFRIQVFVGTMTIVDYVTSKSLELNLLMTLCMQVSTKRKILCPIAHSALMKLSILVLQIETSSISLPVQRYTEEFVQTRNHSVHSLETSLWMNCPLKIINWKDFGFYFAQSVILSILAQ